MLARALQKDADAHKGLIGAPAHDVLVPRTDPGLEGLALHREKRHKRRAGKVVRRDALGFPEKLSEPP